MAKNDDWIGMAIAGGAALLLAIFGIKALGNNVSQPSGNNTGSVPANSSSCSKCPFS